jgi:hypothetical protein
MTASSIDHLNIAFDRRNQGATHAVALAQERTLQGYEPNSRLIKEVS